MKRNPCILATLVAIVAVPALHAVTLSYDTGIVHETDGFASFNTTGEQMAGMGVYVEYADGSTYNTTWQKLGTGFGGVNDSGFYIHAAQTGTSGFEWLLYNPTASSIRSVRLDGQPGNTVFDVAFPFGQFAGFGFVGTPGTSGGREFDLRSLYSIYNDLSITYSDVVALQGADPVGDVFRWMTIEFASNRLLAPGGLIEFGQDTDSLAFGSVLAPVTPANVPEGGTTLTLFCLGLAGMAIRGRRRMLVC